MPKHRRRQRSRGAALVIVLILLALAPALASKAAANPRQRCFVETGYCIEDRFLEYWEQHGGLPIFGYPRGPQAPEVSREDGRTYSVQWFERARFERHPENPRPDDVLLGRIGDDALLLQGRDWWREGREAGPKDDCLWFESTGHNVCDVAPGLGFGSYWRQHGLRRSALNSYVRSVARFGLPMTEARLEINPDDGQLYRIQWFERARFENHVEQSGASGTVTYWFEAVGAGQTTLKMVYSRPFEKGVPQKTFAASVLVTSQ